VREESEATDWVRPHRRSQTNTDEKNKMLFPYVFVGVRLCGLTNQSLLTNRYTAVMPLLLRRRSGERRPHIFWMTGPSFHASLVEARALLGGENVAHILSRGVHDRAQ